MPTTAPPDSGTAVPAMGLSEAEAARRLAEYGPNDPAPSRQRSTVAALLLLFLNPLAIVLLIAAVFSAFLGQAVDAVIIVSVVMIGNADQFLANLSIATCDRTSTRGCEKHGLRSSRRRLERNPPE